MRLLKRGALGSLLALSATSPAASRDLIDLGSQGVTVALPDGWEATLVRKDMTPPDYNTELKAKCTSNSCTVSVFDRLAQGTDLEALTRRMGSAGDQYRFTRRALINTGPEARVARAIEIETLGKA
jgi:hypothetical protein